MNLDIVFVLTTILDFCVQIKQESEIIISKGICNGLQFMVDKM